VHTAAGAAMGRGLRAPVRPTTPPQLRLNLDFGTAKQREVMRGAPEVGAD
jgi:hypothetical protein